MKANLKIVAGVGAAMLFAGSANAAVLSATAANYSKEGVTTTGNVTLPTITAILAADYSIEDRVTVTVAGASIVAATDLTAAISCPNAPGNGIIFGFLNRVGNVLTFRVTQVDVANNLGATCFISGIQVTKASLAASTSVTATYAARTFGGEVIDTGCANPGSPGTLRACATNETPNVVTLATVASQFKAGLATNSKPLNGVIDVEQDRKLFAFPDELTNDNVSDTFQISVTNTGTLLEAVTPVSGKLTLKGDFSFLAGKDAKCGTADDTGSVISSVLAAAGTVAADCASVSFNYGAAFPANANTTVADNLAILIPTGANAVKLSPQMFSATYAFTYPTDKSTSIDFAAGAWTINGALVFVPYMPYADGISQIIYIANRGTQTADITVDAFDENGASYSFDVGQVAGGSVRKLTAEILNGLATAGFVAPGKVAFELTVNAPDADIDVYSAYNVGGSDRGTVVNSQNGKALQ